MKTSQVITSGCWCCVCFPFCLESLRRVEHSCPRFSFSFLFSPGYCFALEFKIIVADFCLFGIVNVMQYVDKVLLLKMQKDLAHVQCRLSSCWLIVFFPELNILDRVADAERPCTSTMGACDSGTLMNNGRTEGSTSTDDLKSNL